MKPDLCLQVRSLAVAAVFLCLGAAPGAAESAELPVGTYTPEPIFNHLDLDRPLRLQPIDGGFLVLDQGNHRLLALTPAGQVRMQIGQVGQAPGELRHPKAYALGPKGDIRVITGTNPFGVHSFGQDGKFLGVVHQGKNRDDSAFFASRSIAVDRNGDLLLSQPRQKLLVTRYSSTGKEKGGFGEKLTPTSVHPESCQEHQLCQDRRYAVTLNRVLIDVAIDGAVAVAAETVPIVRKYASDGSLVFETWLSGGVIDDLKKAQWGSPEEWNYYSFNADGVQVLRMITGLSVDPSTGWIYCMVGSESIFVLSPKGEQLAILRQDRDPARSLESLVVRDGVAYMNDWRWLYRAQLVLPLVNH